MKLVPVLFGLVCSLLVAGQVGAESWSIQLTPKKTNESFTIKVDRLKETDKGEFLQFHVTVKLKDNKVLPMRSRELRVFNGKEFVSSCEVQPTGSDGERLFSFRIAAKYAEKSTFTYAETNGRGDHIGYWFYLKDFVEPKPEPWAGEPVAPSKFVTGGKMSTFKRLPKAADVTALRISQFGNRKAVDLTVANFPTVLDSLKPVKADDLKYKEWSYADWCSAEFETSAGRFHVTFYLGELAHLAAPDGSVGMVTYEPPKIAAAPVVAGDTIKIEDGRGFYTLRSGASFRAYWESLTDVRKMKGKVSDHLAKEQIASVIMLEVNIAIPQGDYLQNELLAFVTEGNRFETGPLPKGFEKADKYLVALFRTKKGDYGLIARYETFAVIELNGVFGVAPVVAADKIKKPVPAKK